jgi:DNA-binding IclR family transcriptional regulator
MATSTAPRQHDDRRSVDKAMSLLKAFGQEAHLGIGVSELARRADLGKSTAFRLLVMLERNGVVERAGSAYRLGRVLHDLGSHVYSASSDAVRDTLTPHLADLYEATHQTVHLAVLHGTDVVYLNKLYGHRQIASPSKIGGRVPAYCTGVGKALLAYDELAAESTMRGPMHAWTTHTITDADELREQLTVIRRTGVAYDVRESMNDLTCVAAPVMGPHGRPIAAMSVSGAADRFSPAEFERVLRRVTYAASLTVPSLMRTHRVA